MFEAQIEGSIVPALRRYRLIFMHVGSLLCPEILITELLASCEERGIGAWHTTEGKLKPPESSHTRQLALVSGLERLADSTSRSRCQLLGRLRSEVTAVLEGGTEVLLISRAPASTLKGCPGSSIVLDAKPVFVDRLEVDVMSAEFPQLPASELRLASGLPRLLMELSFSGNGEPAEEILRRTLVDAVAELGQAAAAWVEQELCKNDRWVASVKDLDQGLVDAARGSGLAASSDQWSTFRLFDGVDEDTARSAVLRACRNETRPDEAVSRASACIWEIERLMRLFVERRLEESGRRIESVLGEETAKRSIRRAQADGYGAVVTVDTLPNVLDWLTMGELADVLAAITVPASSGFRLQFWQRLVSELAAVRNKLAHMRLITEEDIRLAENWRSRVRRVKVDGVS